MRLAVEIIIEDVAFLCKLTSIVETQYLASPHRFAPNVFFLNAEDAEELNARCLAHFFYFTRSARNFMERTKPRAFWRCLIMLVSAKRCIEGTERRAVLVYWLARTRCWFGLCKAQDFAPLQIRLD